MYPQTSDHDYQIEISQQRVKQECMEKNKVANQSKSLLLTEPPLAVNRSSTAMKESNTYGGWEAKNGTANCNRVAIGLPVKFIIPDKISACDKKKVGRGRCHLQRSPQSPPSLSDTGTHVCIHSIFSPSSTFLYWATWQQQQHMEVGQGRGPPTTPTHQQQLCQAPSRCRS